MTRGTTRPNVAAARKGFAGGLALMLMTLAPHGHGGEAGGGPGEDPCALLTLAEVRAVLPEARASERDRGTDKYGIFSCEWKDARGARILIVQRWAAEDPLETEIRSRMEGLVDPLKPAATNAIRVESLAGVGQEARAAILRRDEARGVLSDMALLVAKRGDHVVALSSPDLAKAERAQALKGLESLGRAAAARLR